MGARDRSAPDDLGMSAASRATARKGRHLTHATAVLLKKIGDKAEAVKDLAYILYDISANKRQDAKEATAYNALIADWTELSRQAASNLDTRGNLQQRLDL